MLILIINNINDDDSTNIEDIYFSNIRVKFIVEDSKNVDED